MPVEMEREFISLQKVFVITLSPSLLLWLHVFLEEVDELFRSAGMEQRQLHMDRRLQVNRGKQVCTC